MLYIAVVLGGVAFLAMTGSFPILAFRSWKMEGFSLFTVVWGVTTISFGLLVWAIVGWVWWSVFMHGTMPW